MHRCFPGGTVAKNTPTSAGMQETWVWSLVLEDALGEEMANDSNIFTWKVPWTEEPGGLQPTGLQSWRQLSNWACTHHIQIYYTMQIMSKLYIYIYLCVYVYMGFPGMYMYIWASLVAQMVKNRPPVQEIWAQSLGWEDPLEKGMATHLSFLVYRVPKTEEPGWL